MTETAAAVAAPVAPETTEAKEPQGEDTTEQTETAEPVTEEAEVASEVPDYRKMKHKIPLPDGEEEVEYDELVRNYTKNKVLTKREQENAKTKKEVQAAQDKLAGLLHKAKNDPNLVWQLVQELGHDPETLAIHRAREAMEWEKKSEPEKRAIIAERKLAELEAARESEEAERLEDEKQFYAKQIEEETQDDILAVIKELGDKVDEADIETIAQIQGALYDTRETKPEPQEVARFVLARRQQVAERYLKKVLASGKVEDLPKDLLNAVQKLGVEKAKSASKVPSIPPSHAAASGSKDEKSNKKAVSVNSFFKNLGSR